MEAPPSLSALGALPSAFAAACRQARSDGELFEHCRGALVKQFHSDRIWLSVTSPTPLLHQLPPPEWVASAVEVIRLGSGQTEVVILAEPAVARDLSPHATAIALGLSVMLELHGVLRDRQLQLEDAAFQLRALRQVARLLSSVHSTEETENLVLDFMAEVFFCWWAVLYRPVGGEYRPKVVRSLKGSMSPESLSREEMDRVLPPVGPVTSTTNDAVARLLPPTAQLAVSLDAAPNDWPSWPSVPGCTISGSGRPRRSWRLPWPSPRPSRSRTPTWWSSCRTQPPPTRSPGCPTGGQWKPGSTRSWPAPSATRSAPA